MGSVQLVAGVVCVFAVVGFGWIAIWRATYPAPWALPWQSGSRGGQWPTINAAIRLVVLAGLAVVVAWPYFGGTPGFSKGPVGFGWFPAPIRPTKVDLTWLLVVLAVAGTIAVGLLIGWSLRGRGRYQRTAEVQPQVADDRLNLSELTDETLQAMVSERDPRRAILACYARMERGLASRGIPRAPEETALEYMRRLLEGAGAPNDPLRSLTALFHLAGFSAQPMDESMRETAISALRAISAGAP
jgi:uncharacterized protein DUF4129